MSETKLENVSFDDIMNNPHKYGLPSFEEFRKNPDPWREKWRGRHDEIMAIVDAGSANLKHHVVKHRYRFGEWEESSLERIEKLANDHGLSVMDLDFTSKVVPIGGGKCDILVEFAQKK